MHRKCLTRYYWSYRHASFFLWIKNGKRRTKTKLVLLTLKSFLVWLRFLAACEWRKKKDIPYIQFWNRNFKTIESKWSRGLYLAINRSCDPQNGNASATNCALFLGINYVLEILSFCSPFTILPLWILHFWRENKWKICINERAESLKTIPY